MENNVKNVVNGTYVCICGGELYVGKSVEEVTVEGLFEGELTLQAILGTWLKNHFKGDQK
ncbi:hypothetical protein AB4114_22190 [Paenibacillus sp. 2RAB27]|uniref:hypothetical protein n=1 Tax=Paenibacillus sp. 2RAB27 TaxID=3232991 RepID=UPI003F9529ED